MAFSIESSAFDDGGQIPAVHTCEGADRSPELGWEDAPAGTRSFALIVEDPDAPGGTFIHWVLYDLPAASKGLAAGLAKEPTLPGGARQGMTGFGRIGYRGPCPPPGDGYHRYFFRLMALDVESLGLAPGASAKAVEEAARGHVIGEATLVGRYRRF
ncbi:MAG TPA: YbhB/YbcL family Raf kinase inhibitor-like protein [Deltaproteobacteria bacterium]|nr:YbhB/YbcL family Raf kinase inhibitor-like protein [Deltaproteobacteria bacterium]